MLDLHPEFHAHLRRDASIGRAKDPAAVEIITTLEGLELLKPDYARLEQSTKNRVPFALHEWHAAWWRHFAGRTARVRDGLMVFVFRDPAGRCVALFPFVATDRYLGPLRLRTMSMLGPDPYISEFRVPLIEPGYEADVVRLLRAHLAADDRWDWVHWSGVREAFGAALAHPRIEWSQPVVDYVLDLPATWELFRAGLKRNIRESLRHCYNSLKRDGLAFELEVAQKPADVSRALEPFLALHAMRAGMAGSVPHLDRFDGPKTKGFLRDVCARLAERGVARIFSLKIRGQIVAARIGFVVGDSLYLYFSGYDPEWRKYSVMTTTVAEAIQYAIAQKLSTVSLSAGTDISKTRWGARPVEWAEALECRRSVRSQIAHKAYRSAMDLKRTTGPGWASIFELFPKRDW